MEETITISVASTEVVLDVNGLSTVAVAAPATVLEVIAQPLQVNVETEVTQVVEISGGLPGPQNLFVQQTQPSMIMPGLWVETRGDGTVKTIWAGTTS